MELDADTIERIAQRVAQLLRERQPADVPPTPARLVDAATLARRLGVRREWVYRHAQQLGAMRLGGPHGRMRFDLDQALRDRDEEPEAGQAEQRNRPGRSGLGFAECTTYSRKGSTNSGRAARQRPRPDTGSTSHPMQRHRSATNGRR